jgi:tryptophan-rich sensory protein
MPYQKNLKTKIAVLFGINLLLNVFWSFLFFALQKPIFSFFELIILFLSILWIMFAVWKVSKTSYFLLTPYLLWVIFAGVLNYLIAF